MPRDESTNQPKATYHLRYIRLKVKAIARLSRVDHLELARQRHGRQRDQRYHKQYHRSSWRHELEQAGGEKQTTTTTKSDKPPEDDEGEKGKMRITLPHRPSPRALSLLEGMTIYV